MSYENTMNAWNNPNRQFNDDWEYANCDCCQGKNAKKMCAKGNLTYVRCTNCGLIYLNPRPKDTAIIYTADYFLDANAGIGYNIDYERDFDKYARHLSEFHLTNINKLHPKKGKFLDIGCATGNFLEMVKQNGWEPFGIEISEYAANRARKKIGSERIFQSNVEDAKLPDGYFDVISACEIIEHIPHPTAFLLEVRRIIKNNGLLVITTPNGNSVLRAILKDRWFQYKLEHRYLFYLPTLQLLLRKTGFKIAHKDFKPYMALLQFLRIDLEISANLLRTKQANTRRVSRLKAKLLPVAKSIFRKSLGRYLSDSIWIYAQPNKAEI